MCAWPTSDPKIGGSPLTIDQAIAITRRFLKERAEEHGGSLADYYGDVVSANLTYLREFSKQMWVVIFDTKFFRPDLKMEATDTCLTVDPQTGEVSFV